MEHFLDGNDKALRMDLLGLPADGNMPLLWAPVEPPLLSSGKYNLTDEWKTFDEVDEIVGESPPLSLSWMSLMRHCESWLGLQLQCGKEQPLLVYFQLCEQVVLEVPLHECDVEGQYLLWDGQALWLPMVFPPGQ